MIPTSYSTRTVAVLGGGVLGRRIAACWTAASYNVIIRDPSEKQRAAAVDYVNNNIGTYTAITYRKPGVVEATEDLQYAVKSAWLVIEAVPEHLEIKEATCKLLSLSIKQQRANRDSCRSREIRPK